jgi:hypothetical protein
VFVVEQNRDAQMRSLLVNELDVDPPSWSGAAFRRHADHRALHHEGHHEHVHAERRPRKEPRRSA